MPAPFDGDALLPLGERLAQRAEKVLDLHAESTQLIRITASAALAGLPSHRREAAILRIAEALLTQIVTQAMHMRLQGRITLTVTAATVGQTRLTVTHDGWNMEAPPAEGWLQEIRALTAAEGGAITMSREALSVVTLLLPREGPYPVGAH